MTSPVGERRPRDIYGNWLDHEPCHYPDATLFVRDRDATDFMLECSECGLYMEATGGSGMTYLLDVAYQHNDVGARP